jgi:hypothetical protein
MLTLLHGGNMLTYVDKDDGIVEITSGSVSLGILYKELDGYYVWLPPLNMTGYIPAWALLSIYNNIEELNKEWDLELQKAMT